MSREIEKLRVKKSSDERKLEKLEAQQKNMQERCPHNRIERGDDDLIYCKDCLAVVGYTGSPEPDDNDNDNDDEEEEEAQEEDWEE